MAVIWLMKPMMMDTQPNVACIAQHHIDSVHASF